MFLRIFYWFCRKNRWRWRWGMYRREGEGEECVYVCCVDWKRKRKENKSESDRPKREKWEWIVSWVEGLGGEHVGTNNLIFFFFFLTDGTFQSLQKTLFFKIWLFTFLLTLLHIHAHTNDSIRASRENFERETLVKTRLTHPQSLPKRLFKFLYSFPLHCQTLERLITKTFSHHIHFCERVIWCIVKQLGKNQSHISWCYGQVAESGKLEKK